MNRTISSGYSRHPDPSQAAKEAYEQAATSLEGKPHSALLFCSHHHCENLSVICESIPVEHCFAGTGYGAISNFGESEDEPGLAVLLIADPKLALFSKSLPFSDEIDDELEWGRRTGQGLEKSEVLWLLLNTHAWAESIAEGLAQQVPGALIAGGSLSGPWPGPMVWEKDRNKDVSSWAVGVSGVDNVEWTLSQALAPLDGYLPVAGLVGDRLQRLGDKPAMEVARELLGETRFQAFSKGDLLLYARTPGGESGRADRLFSVSGVDEANRALFVPGIPEDTDELALAVHNGEAALKEFRVQLQDLKSRMAEPLFAIYLNCCGRGQDLYGRLNVDAEAFAEAFPGVPMVGVSVGYELAPREHGARLCSYTGILVLVS